MFRRFFHHLDVSITSLKTFSDGGEKEMPLIVKNLKENQFEEVG